MASLINPYNIDGTFPIANQDNSSQGFRDNFTSIKNNFVFAQNEIDDLQSKVLLTSPLLGQTLNNDMAGAQLRHPQLASWTQSLYDLGHVPTNTPTTLDFNTANFQRLQSTGTAGTIALNFINWPPSSGAGQRGYGLMRVWINITDISHTVTTPASVNISIDDIAGALPNGDGTWTITFDAPGNYVFDFSSIDNGTNYLIFDVTRNRATLRDPMLYLNNNINPTLMIGYDGGLQTALTLEQGQDRVSSQGSYNSVAVGNIQLANVAYTQFDTGGIAGYSVTGARGDLTSISNVRPVHSGDFLGYVNSIGFTGNGTPVVGNVFQQLASINFFATGSNVSYGLGGNIAFFTADDGGTQINKVAQAVGIENDQSVKFFGNVTVAGNLNVANVTYTNSEVVTTTEIITGNITAGNVVVSVSPNVSANTTQVATTAFVQNLLPTGGIIMWSGSSTAIPYGWHLCDGTNSTPDLRGQFIVGAGGSYAVGATGGSANAIVVSHTHGITDSGHTHTYHNSDSHYTDTSGTAGQGGNAGTFVNTNVSVTGITINSTGASGTNANLPPYYALCYIMKVV